MKQQNDWYTGINHYHNYPEKEITIEHLRITEPTALHFHQRAELYYVLSGSGSMDVNGISYKAREGSLFCLYSHHFHHITQVEVPLEVAVVRFHIGLFMYMSWEKHPRNANATLVYDTQPMVYLEGKERERTALLISELLEENETPRFESRNLIEYKTLELHAYFCRFAYEAAQSSDNAPGIWDVITRVVLASSKSFTLQDAAESLSLTPARLNQQITRACGYTFHQLVHLGKSLNACALLHFPELSMEYISDLLEFSSVQAFYRFFEQHFHMSPREYQKKNIGSSSDTGLSANFAIRFLQYLHQHFYENITLETLCGYFCLKPYTARKIFQNSFGCTFQELLGQIRTRYACSLLCVTDKTILEISSLCGFDSLSTFQRVFARWMNQTPGEYREAMISRPSPGDNI